MTIYVNTRTGKATIARRKPRGFFSGKKPKPYKFKTKVNRLISSIEKKHIDKAIGIDFANNTSPLSLTLLSQGDTSSTRTGLKIFLKSLVFHYTIDWADTATQETNCRLLLVLDKNSNGALPAVTDILETATTDSLYNNINEGRRFVVLMDKHINNKNPTTAVPRDEGGSFKMKINKNIWYLNSGETATALGRNQLYLIPLGDVTNSHADAVSIDGNMRLYFDDL